MVTNHYFRVRNASMAAYLGYIILFGICINDVRADPSGVTSKDNDRGNRWEGLTSYTVSTRFRLVACHAGEVPKYVVGNDLYLGFYVPKNSTATKLTAQRIAPGSNRYGMLVKKTDWKSGWQTFGPWPVGEVLIPLSISNGSLAVLIHREDGGCLPTTIGLTPREKSLRNLTYYFHTPEDIEELTWKAIAGEDGEIVDNGKIVDIWGPDQFAIPFELPNKKGLGNYKLVIRIKWTDGESIETYSVSWPSRNYL